MFLAATLDGGSHEYIKSKKENISRKRVNFAKLTTMDILSEQRYFYDEDDRKNQNIRDFNYKTWLQAYLSKSNTSWTEYCRRLKENPLKAV